MITPPLGITYEGGPASWLCAVLLVPHSWVEPGAVCPTETAPSATGAASNVNARAVVATAEICRFVRIPRTSLWAILSPDEPLGILLEEAVDELNRD